MITARPLALADLPAVVGLLHDYDRRWLGEPVLTADDLRAEWTSPEFDLDRDSEGWDDDGALAAFGTLDPRGGVELAVAPSWADAGLEDALLDRWEAEGRRRGFVALHRHLAAADEPGRRRLEGRGWTVDRTGWLLRLAPEVEVEERPLPVGYAVRPMRDADLEAVYAVVSDAFAPYNPTRRSYADWRAGSVDRPDVTVGHGFVVTHDGEVVGACLLADPATPDDAAAQDAGAAEPEAWVPQLAVRGDHRRQGLARELLARTALAARARGVPALALYTHSGTGALGLYERFGMVVRHTLVECGLRLEP